MRPEKESRAEFRNAVTHKIQELDAAYGALELDYLHLRRKCPERPGQESEWDSLVIERLRLVMRINRIDVRRLELLIEGHAGDL